MSYDGPSSSSRIPSHSSSGDGSGRESQPYNDQAQVFGMKVSQSLLNHRRPSAIPETCCSQKDIIYNQMIHEIKILKYQNNILENKIDDYVSFLKMEEVDKKEEGKKFDGLMKRLRKTHDAVIKRIWMRCEEVPDEYSHFVNSAQSKLKDLEKKIADREVERSTALSLLSPDFDNTQKRKYEKCSGLYSSTEYLIPEKNMKISQDDKKCAMPQSDAFDGEEGGGLTIRLSKSKVGDCDQWLIATNLDETDTSLAAEPDKPLASPITAPGTLIPSLLQNIAIEEKPQCSTETGLSGAAESSGNIMDSLATSRNKKNVKQRVKCRYLDEINDLSPLIKELVGTMLGLIDNLQRVNNSGSQDVASFLREVDSIEEGDAIKVFLEAVNISSENDLSGIHDFQIKYKDEQMMSLVNFKELRDYLEKSVFNSQKLGCTLDGFIQFMNLKIEGGVKKSMPNVPATLKVLVQVFVEILVELRSGSDVPIKVKDFREGVESYEIGRNSLNLLLALFNDELMLDDIHKIQNELKEIGLRTVAEEKSILAHRREWMLSWEEAENLRQYFSKTIFNNNWFLAFDVDGFRNAMRSNPSKL